MAEQTTTTTGALVVSSGWMRIFRSAKVKVAIGGLAAQAITIISTNPYDRQMWATFIWTIPVMVLGLIVSWAYEDGKLKEGMVPQGYKPAQEPMQMIMGEAMPMMTAPGQPVAVDPSQIDPAAQQPQTEAPGVQVRPAGARIQRLSGVLLLWGLIGLSGCAGTSEGFKRSVQSGVPNMARAARGYVERDTALAPEAAQVRLALSFEMEASVADKAKITVDGVDRPWQAVKPWYAEYVRTDERLTPVETKWKLDTIQQLDALIMEERKRRGILFVP